MLHRHDSGYRFCPRCGHALSSRCVKEGEPDRLCCDGCEFIFYLDPKLAAGVVAHRHGQIVLVQRAIEPAYGRWMFPGGYVDRGEHPEQAAVRETREEAGIEVRVDGLLGIYSYPPGSAVIIVVYHGEIIGGELAALDECLDARFCSLGELPWPDLAFPTTRLAMADYLRLRGLQPPSGVLPE